MRVTILYYTYNTIEINIDIPITLSAVEIRIPSQYININTVLYKVLTSISPPII